MKELQEGRAADSDSGQASEEEAEEMEKEEGGGRPGRMVSSDAAKQLNGASPSLMSHLYHFKTSCSS